MVFLFPVALVFSDVWLSYLSKKTLELQHKVASMVIYAGATATSLVLITIRVFLFFTVSLRSSQWLHDRMIEAARPTIFLRHKSSRANLEPFFKRHWKYRRRATPELYLVYSKHTLSYLSFPATSDIKSMVVIQLLPNYSGIHST